MLNGIAARRLINQQLSAPRAKRVTDVVKSFGAMQAQDYAAAKWALGLRVPGTRSADIDKAFDEGRILRTHVMRPTWHFVDPSIIRWLLALTGPRVHAACASRYRELEIDSSACSRSQRVITRMLRGGLTATRSEIGAALERAGVPVNGQRLAFLLLAAELNAVVCSGPRRGSQFTYALLEERVPAARPLPADAALAELAKRYFATHGPATARDLAWWAGTTLATARAAIESLGSFVVSERVGALTYWTPASAKSAPRARRALYLLPTYDEYVVAYRDREAVPYEWSVRPSGSVVPTAFMNPVVIDGEIVGTWRRTLTPRMVNIEVIGRRALTPRENRALRQAADAFGAFVEKPVTVAK